MTAPDDTCVRKAVLPALRRRGLRNHAMLHSCRPTGAADVCAGVTPCCLA
jgi:hypothetical protein